MPADPNPAQTVLMLLTLGALSLMLAAWAWAIGRVASGQGLLPPASVRIVPWRGKHVIGMFVLFLIVKEVVEVALLAAGLIPTKGAGAVNNPTWPILAMAAVSAAYLLVAVPILKWTTGARLADFGLERGRVGRDVGRGLVAWPLVAPIVFGVNLIALAIWQREPHPVEKAIQRDATSTIGLATVSAVVLAPLVEEFLFRGLMLGWLGRWAAGLGRSSRRPTDPSGSLLDPEFDPALAPTGLPPDVDFYIGPETVPPPKPAPLAARGWRYLAANLAVSLVFASLHAAAWPSPVPLFFLSLGLGVLYQRTGSLVAPVTLHATFNGLSTLLMYLGTLAGGAQPPPVPPEARMSRILDVDVAVSARPDRNLNSRAISVDRDGVRW